jgi:E3 ubiquitin-protein ligase UBR1
LKEQFLAEIDPYIAHYNKNNREESENAYKTWFAKKTGTPIADIVFEPKLRPIASGAFSDLSAFTRTGIFAQIIYYSLLYPLNAEEFTPTVPVTRVEAFLQVVLHLILIAIVEDNSVESDTSEESLRSFVYISLNSTARSISLKDAPSSRTIAAILEVLSRKEAFKSCHPKIALVLKRMKQKRPVKFEDAFARLGVSVDRISTASPAIDTSIAERQRKKQAALDRQAKVMAKFQLQQKTFLDNQGGNINWGDEDMDNETIEEESEPKTYIQHPSGMCIFCQEDTKDGRLYGTFALLTKSTLLRQTDFKDPDFIREVAKSPESLDQSAEALRPAGIAGENREQKHKVTSSGLDIVTERQFIGKGFPSASTRSGPVSVGCGHIMHYKCFEAYYDSIIKRHQHQIARQHAELLEQNEFTCPLCKALGNAFLPVVWAPKEEVYPRSLQIPTDSEFNDWLVKKCGSDEHKQLKINEVGYTGKSLLMSMFENEIKQGLTSSLADKASELLMDAWDQSLTEQPLEFRLGAGAGARIGELLSEGAIAPFGDLPSQGSIVNPAMDNESPSTVSPMNELVAIYRRLRDTMSQNELPTRHPAAKLGAVGRLLASGIPEGDLSASDTLAYSLGYSISAVEIQHRGIAAPLGTTLLESISHSAITHLRVLAETALSYVSVGGIKSAGANQIAREFCGDYERQYTQLFLASPYPDYVQAGVGTPGKLSSMSEKYAPQPLLNEDIFIFLTECSLCLAPVDGIKIMHLVRLCYTAEIVKAVLLLSRNSAMTEWRALIASGQEIPRNTQNVFERLCLDVWLVDDMGREVETTHAFNNTGVPLDGPSFVQKYALAFLRKVVVLLHVRYGVAFNNYISSNPAANELTRLTEMLKLPSFDEMCAAIDLRSNTDLSLGGLARHWIKKAEECGTTADISLSHPVIFELIGLPKNYDTLMEETMKRRCPTTGKDVSDPMLCLFCGDIFCGQAICCLKEGPKRLGKRAQQIGGAQQHMLKYVLSIFHKPQ